MEEGIVSSQAIEVAVQAILAQELGKVAMEFPALPFK